MNLNRLSFIILAIFIIILICREGCNYISIKKRDKEIKALNTHISELKDTCSSWRRKIDTFSISLKPQAKKTSVLKKVTKDSIIYADHSIVKQISDSVANSDYYAVRIYNDTSRIKYGNVITFDTVSMNKIIGRRIDFDLKIPEIKETIFVPEKKKTKLFFGINTQFYGNRYNASGISLLLENKKRRTIYEVGAMLDKYSQHLYQASVKFSVH